MTRFVVTLFCFLLMVPTTSLAQEDDKSSIETWLEDALSSAGRDVRITGFRGAFSSEAAFETLTIADDDGVWLRVEDAQLIWSRRALLSGRVDINEISADHVHLLRKPLPGPAVSTEDSQSWTFAVPELPVALELDQLDIQNITLDPSVMGQAVQAKVSGNAQLEGGQVAVNIEALRQDKQGRFGIIADFANDSRSLSLDLALTEGAGGLVATLLNIPDAPALSMTLAGAAPISDFTATLNIETEGVSRFGGDLRYQETVENDTDANALEQTFTTALSGDLRPLFKEEFHPFFGATSTLDVSAVRSENGALDVQDLRLETEILKVAGALQLGADQIPQTIDLRGDISSDDPVRLPTSGAALTLRELGFQLQFDAAQSNAWTADIVLADFVHDSVTVPRAQLKGLGLIDKAPQRVTGDIQFSADQLAFSDPKFARALSGAQNGRINFAWQEGGVVTFNTLRLENQNAVITAEASLGTLENGVPLTGSGRAELTDLSPFSALARRGLQGAAQLDIAGRYDLLGGGFDVDIKGLTEDLAVDIPQLDPLLQGRAEVDLSAARAPDGTQLERLDISAPTAEIRASGVIAPESGALDLDVALTDISLVDARVAGPASATTRVLWSEAQGFDVQSLNAEVAKTKVTGAGTYNPTTDRYAGRVQVNSLDLSQFAELSGQDLSGQLNMRLEGAATPSQNRYEIATTIDGNGVKSGIAQLDPLLVGTLSGRADLAANDRELTINELQLTTSQISLSAQSEAQAIGFALALKDLAKVAPGFGGPLDMNGRVTLKTPDGSTFDIAANATGPAGITLRANGSVMGYGQSLDLSLTGAAPLGLANSFIAPNSIQGDLRYDLALRGAPTLGALRGQATIGNGRVALPDSGVTINQINGAVALSGGQAVLDIAGQSDAGGGLELRGPVALQGGNNANLAIQLNGFGVSDPELFATTVSGNVSVAGPLTGQARISGALQLGATEIIVPSGGSVSGSDLLDIRHVNAPAAVRSTITKAGAGPKGAKGSATAFPLDVSISAPNQIFVRGRGLDAELGGNLRIGGTTADMIPSGSFELIRGRFDILGRRFVMNEGLINLQGRLDPFLRFVAETATTTGMVRVILEGLASAPELRFESDPDLPQEEAIAQLLFGRSLDTISPLQAASLVSAIATLSGQSSGGVTGRLRSALGLSDFDVTTSETGATQLRAGAYLNENTYSEFTIDSEGNQEINLNLDITPNLTAKGGTNSLGNTGIGLFFQRDY